MDKRYLNNILSSANDFATVSTIETVVYDFAARNFTSEAPCRFSSFCELAKKKACDYRIVHSYGCFEAERWNGLYIYYCPMSLVFVSTVIFEGRRAAYAMVCGPIVMGLLEDALHITEGLTVDTLAQLPQRTPSEVQALSNLQWQVAMYLSHRSNLDAAERLKSQASLHNSLYDMMEQMRDGQNICYPLELEQSLQRMIMQGNKQGAQDLINQLLGALYFSTRGNFQTIKERSKELVILFSRAAIAGGADLQQIFVQNHDYLAEIDSFISLDELSVFFISLFNRFVGYVFDFSQYEHANIFFKAMNYIRENLANKLTLEDLAAHLAISRSYLSKLFKTELGETFTDQVNLMRIKKSQELLLDQRLSLSEIASMVGYSDQSYYTKQFSKITGLSPGQYRKKQLL